MPFQNELSSLWPWLTRMGKKFPKTVGKFTNMDLLKPFGGGFTLEHTTPMKVILNDENLWSSNIFSSKVKPFNSWE